MTHGFRKYFTGRMKAAGVSELDIDKLLGHKSKGLMGRHYYRPDESELLGEYLKAVDMLTIDDSKRLQRENEMLKVRKSEYEALKEDLDKYKQSHDGLQKAVAKLSWHDYISRQATKELYKNGNVLKCSRCKIKSL